MTRNSQLSTTEPKKKKKQNQKQTKQTRTGTESQQWKSHRELSVGWVKGENEKKVQGISHINGSYKIDRGKLRIVWEMEKPKNLYV